MFSGSASNPVLCLLVVDVLGSVSVCLGLRSLVLVFLCAHVPLRRFNPLCVYVPTCLLVSRHTCQQLVLRFQRLFDRELRSPHGRKKTYPKNARTTHADSLPKKRQLVHHAEKEASCKAAKQPKHTWTSQLFRLLAESIAFHVFFENLSSTCHGPLSSSPSAA